jgi:outer membrane protein assembly factor BamB
MMRHLVPLLGFVVVSLALSASVSGGASFAPKEDNRIVCVDLYTGKLLWEYVPKKLSQAEFELYPGGLVADPQIGWSGGTPLYLDAGTGKPIAEFKRDPSRLLAKSATFFNPPIELNNGWRLADFLPLVDQTLTFRDKAGAKEVWKIETGRHPDVVRSWKDDVFYAQGYLSDDCILYAYRAGGTKPAWTADLNQVVKGRKEPLTRMIFQVIDDTLYVEADEHIFAFEPGTGKLLWHRDLAKDLHLEFVPDFYGGGLNLAVFAKSRDVRVMSDTRAVSEVLVVSFERRVVALDLTKGKYLWHMEPDTFPHTPFPVVSGDKLFLTVGAKRTLKQITDK